MHEAALGSRLCPVRRLFSDWERQGVVQCWTGRQEWGTASSVAACEVYSSMSLVDDPVRIWIASSQIVARMLEFSNCDVRRRRSDSIKQRSPGKRKDADGGGPADTLFTRKPHANRQEQPARSIKIDQDSDKCSDGRWVKCGSELGDQL
jgi:hypothetical protein